jgi:hypothetical protein
VQVESGDLSASEGADSMAAEGKALTNFVASANGAEEAFV